jgi:hypothetical protein
MFVIYLLALTVKAEDKSIKNKKDSQLIESAIK